MVTPQLPAYLRTYVPIVWGWLVGLVLTNIPGVESLLLMLNIDPNAPAILAAITGALAIGWYALMRKIEAYIPDWLTSILLGSPQVPEYDGTTAGSPPAEAGETVFEPGDAEAAEMDIASGQSEDPNIKAQPDTAKTWPPDLNR
jgi:hypothetical protein